MTEEEGRERERERRRRRWGKVRRGKHLGRGRTRREEEPQAELARPLSLSLHPSSQIPGPLRVASLVSSWLLSAFLCAPALVSFRAFLLERRPKKKKKQKSVSYQQSGKPWTGHTVKTGIVQLVWFHYSGRNVANEQTNNHQEKTFPLVIFFPPDWTTYWLEILSLSLDLATQTGHSGKWSRIVSLLHRRDLGANRNEKFGRRKGTQLAFSGYLCTYLVYCMRLKVTVEWLKEAKTVLESRILSSVHPKDNFLFFSFSFDWSVIGYSKLRAFLPVVVVRRDLSLPACQFRRRAYRLLAESALFVLLVRGQIDVDVTRSEKTQQSSLLRKKN